MLPQSSSRHPNTHTHMHTYTHTKYRNPLALVRWGLMNAKWTHCYLSAFTFCLSLFQESFMHIEGWLQDIDQHAGKNVSKLLVGNKCDLIHKKVVDSVTAKVRASEAWVAVCVWCFWQLITEIKFHYCLFLHALAMKYKQPNVSPVACISGTV